MLMREARQDAQGAATPPQPDLREVQANERTLLAWIRTGITLMAFGFVVARLGVFLRVTAPGTSQQVGFSLFIGAALVILGTLTNVVAAYRYARVRAALLTSTRPQPGPVAGLSLAFAIALIGAFLSVYLLAM
jgi:putative membrane protein